MGSFLPTPLVAPVMLLLLKKTKSHYKEEGILTMTNETYWWSFVKQIFRNCQPSHDGECTTVELMTSTSPIGTFDSVASLLAATHCQAL